MTVKVQPPTTTPVRVKLTTQITTEHTIPVSVSSSDDDAEAVIVALAELERDLLFQGAASRPAKAHVIRIQEFPKGVDEPYDYDPGEHTFSLGHGSRISLH